MSSLATIFGYNASADPRNMMAEYLIINALWSHTLSSTRALKVLYGIDNHVSPREDFEKYGPRAVKDGKISQERLNMLKRNESAHLNSMEHFPIFAASLILAKMAGVPAADINFAGFAYTIARLGFFANYVLSTSLTWAALRPMFWWASNIVCFRLIWRAGKALNGM